MLVLLILLCGPYGLALMWVRGGYTKQTKVRATAVWAGLTVLMLAAAAVTIQSQVGSIIAGTAGLAGVSPARVPPTPILFGTPQPGPGAPKPTLPGGLAAGPPTPVVSPGTLATPPGMVSSQPPASAKPGDDDEAADEDQGPNPDASPPPGAAGAPSAKPTGEQVKVADADGSGVNMRERPGPTGPVIKTVPDGTVLRVVGPDQQMDGKAWKNVRDDAGSTGWIAAELLDPV